MALLSRAGLTLPAAVPAGAGAPRLLLCRAMSAKNTPKRGPSLKHPLYMAGAPKSFAVKNPLRRVRLVHPTHPAPTATPSPLLVTVSLADSCPKPAT